MTQKWMKDQTVADFPVGTLVSISFSDVGHVLGSIALPDFGELLAVMLSDREDARSKSGMNYRLVLVHPANITATLAHRAAHIADTGLEKES